MLAHATMWDHVHSFTPELTNQRMTCTDTLTSDTVRFIKKSENARVHTGHSAAKAMWRYTEVRELPLFAKMFHFHR